MKVITGLILLVFPGLVIYAQEVKTTTPTPPTAPKVIAEISASSDRIVKGAPFSAEALSESIQTLADGNRIVRRWSEKLYRSSDGRFRREGSGVPGSAFGSVITSGSTVTILDPVGGARYTLNNNDKTVRTFTLRTPRPVIVSGQGREPIILNGEGNAPGVVSGQILDRIKTEISAAQTVEDRAAVAAKVVTTVAVPAVPMVPASKWETRTEQLGIQNFEGVDAEGTRTITTIPADAIGNERPIEIVYERWYSKELQLIVYSRHYDPRFGEQTYRLTNIVRSEPDPSLFQVPTSYRMINGPSFQYRTTVSPKVSIERTTTTGKTPQASRP